MIARRDRFRRLYDANYKRILGYALRRTPSGEDAHDVVSEARPTTAAISPVTIRGPMTDY